MDIADYKLTSPKGLLLDRWGRGFLKITRKRRAEWTWLPSQILLVAAEILQHVSASSMWFLETKAKDTSPLGVVPTKGGSLSPQVLLRLREPMGNRRYSSPSACFMCLWSDCIFERKKKPKNTSPNLMNYRMFTHMLELGLCCFQRSLLTIRADFGQNRAQDSKGIYPYPYHTQWAPLPLSVPHSVGTCTGERFTLRGQSEVFQDWCSQSP